MKQQGMVYLIGAGPGSRDLMTLKGMELLKTCDAVVYDHLASDWFLSSLKKDCRILYVGKQAGQHSMSQEEINEALATLAGEGLKVVRLKGGDPFVFGRGGEEILYLKERGIPWELVPGVTSAVAVPELAGIPLTHRGVSRSFHVITGHTMNQAEKQDFSVYGNLEGTLVFLMGFNQLHAIVTGLLRAGKEKDTPAAVIEKGSLPGQRTVRGTLDKIEDAVKEAGLGTPAIIVIGDVAAYDLSSCFKSSPQNSLKINPERPLQGIRVGITGTRSFGDRLEKAFAVQGAQVCRLMELELITCIDSEAVKKAYANLSSYTWLVLTSANGVRIFLEGLLAEHMDIRSLGGIKLAAIGEATAKELLKHGLRADYIPKAYCARSLAEGLAGILTKKDRVLIARSRGGSPELPKILEKAGILFEDIPLYDVCGSKMEDAPSFYPHYLTFASASGVRAWFENGGEERLLQYEKASGFCPKLVCIGDITAGVLKEFGRTADLTAKTYLAEGIADAVLLDLS